MEKLCQLLNQVMKFLESCDEPYIAISDETRENLIYSLVSGQYLLRELDGEIVYFVAYWKIHQKDLETVRELKRPADICTGTILYVVEAGNKGGKESMAEIFCKMKQIQPITAAVWHRHRYGTVKSFKRQKGDTSWA